jgi:hypothetical protein
MNKGIVSSGLKSLMLINEGLRQLEESQVSPQGPEGLPTLAKQLAMAGQQAQGQQVSLPSGVAQPIMDDVAKKSTIGASVTAPIEGLPQPVPPPAQAMAQGGIAGLRADNMRSFKEGGVLGFADGEEVPKAKEESSSPVGRFFKGITDDFSQRSERDELAQKVEDLYYKKATFPGLFMDQTGEERENAKKVMARLPKMSIGELKAIASGEPQKAPLIKDSPTEEALLKYMRLNKDKQPNREPLPPEVIARQNQEALQTINYQDPNRARLDTQAAYTPPVAPTAPRPGPVGPAASQGIAGLAPAGFDLAAAMKQMPPELTQSSKDYQDAIRNKIDFSGQQLSNLDQTRQEMLANRARQDKEAPYLNLQKMFAQGAKSGYAGMGEANIAAKEAQQTLMEARAAQDALARDKIVAIKAANQAEKIGDKAGILAANKDLAVIGVDMAKINAQIEAAKISAAASIEHANIMAKASAANSALNASIERDKMEMKNEEMKMAKADASYKAMNDSIGNYMAKKQAVLANSDKIFALEKDSLMKMAGTNEDSKKEFEEAKLAHEAKKIREGAVYDQYINNVEDVMHKRFGVSHGVPARLDQKALAAPTKTYKY